MLNGKDKYCVRYDLLQSVVSAQMTIPLDREKAWEILRDLSQAHNYVPGIVETQITTDQKEGIGASRKVYQSRDKGIDETVVEWNEGYGFLIRLHRGDAGPPFPFKEAYFRYAVKDVDDSTILTTSLSYATCWGIVGRALDRVLLRRIIRERVADVALSMKIYYETGERVMPDKLKSEKRACKDNRNS